MGVAYTARGPSGTHHFFIVSIPLLSRPVFFLFLSLSVDSYFFSYEVFTVSMKPSVPRAMKHGCPVVFLLLSQRARVANFGCPVTFVVLLLLSHPLYTKCRVMTVVVELLLYSQYADIDVFVILSAILLLCSEFTLTATLIAILVPSEPIC